LPAAPVVCISGRITDARRLARCAFAP